VEVKNQPMQVVDRFSQLKEILAIAKAKEERSHEMALEWLSMVKSTEPTSADEPNWFEIEPK